MWGLGLEVEVLGFGDTFAWGKCQSTNYSTSAAPRQQIAWGRQGGEEGGCGLGDVVWSLCNLLATAGRGWDRFAPAHGGKNEPPKDEN